MRRDTVADLNKLSNSNAGLLRSCGEGQLADANVLLLQPHVVDDQRFFFLHPRGDGKYDEALFHVQGYLLAFDTVPLETTHGRYARCPSLLVGNLLHDCFRAVFKPDTLGHHVKLCGKGCREFERSYKELSILYKQARQFIVGEVKVPDEPAGFPVISAFTQMITRVQKGETVGYPSCDVPPLYKFPDKIIALLNTGRFRFTDNNVVDFLQVNDSLLCFVLEADLE
jgi:hypothetical protein